VPPGPGDLPAQILRAAGDPGRAQSPAVLGHPHQHAAAAVQVHADDLPAVICCLHRGLPTWRRRMPCNFQHPPGSGRLRSFIASRFSWVHVHVWAWRCRRPGPGQMRPAFPRERPAQLRTESPAWGSPRLTCGRDRNRAASAQVKAKREDLTQVNGTLPAAARPCLPRRRAQAGQPRHVGDTVWY
jgi:hypothetical protein